MRILVLGGYGLIGFAVVNRLLAAGHEAVGLGRKVGAARTSCPEATWIEGDIASLTAPDLWRPLLLGIDGVVNAAGALQDGPRDDVQALQSTAMRALFTACTTGGPKRVVQISAVGAQPGAPTLFMRSKAEADAALARTDLDWTILRPGLVLAPTAYGATALVRALASVPLITPLVEGDARLQTVAVEDVAQAVLLALEGAVPARATYDLVEDETRTLAELVAGFRTWLGRAPARRVRVPQAIGRLVFAAGDLVGRLGWRAPMRTTALRQIRTGVTGDPGPWRRATGRRLRNLAETLRERPSTLQERWFGRLILAKPLVIGTLAAFWLASGLIAAATLPVATAVLTARSVEASAATALVVGGIALDLALGISSSCAGPCPGRRSGPFS